MNQDNQINHIYKSKLIASSKDNFNIELVHSLDDETANDIITISKDLKNIYGPNSILTKNNIHKYFNNATLPFLAKMNNNVIGFIIGAAVENFSNQSWVQYDDNLGQNNTLYTYAFIFQTKYRKKGGYSKTLKKIYTSWAKKRGFSFISGHIKKSIFKPNNRMEIIREFPKWYESNEPFIYYRRKI